LAMIYGKSTGSKNSWEGKGATHTQKESMYTMTLIFLSICRFYVYCFIYICIHICSCNLYYLYISIYYPGGLPFSYVITIGSTNCRGIFSDKIKRRDIFQRCRSQYDIFQRCRSQYDISVLIDTQRTKNVENQ